MSAVEDRLKELGLTVPEVAKPVAAYVPALADGRRVYTSGQLPMVNGELAAIGKVGHGEGLVAPEKAAELAQVCALNAIAAVKSVVGDLDKVAQVVKVVGFVASDPSFTGQPASSTAPASCSARPSATRASTHARPSASRCCRWTPPSRWRSSSPSPTTEDP